MPIPSYPSTLPAPRANMSGSVYLPQVRDEMENGSVATRKRFTKAREKLTGFGWDYLTEAQYEALREFFLEVQGGSFTWTHPVRGTTYTLLSSADELIYQHNPGGGYANVEWPLEEK